MNELICSLQKYYNRRGDLDMAVAITDLFVNCEEIETVEPRLKRTEGKTGGEA